MISPLHVLSHAQQVIALTFVAHSFHSDWSDINCKDFEAFYSFNQRFAKIRSKRIQKAVTRITGHMSSELMDIPEVERLTTSQKETKVKRKKSKNDSNKKKPVHQSSNTGECKEQLELQEIVADADKEMRPRGRGRGRGSIVYFIITKPGMVRDKSAGVWRPCGLKGHHYPML